MFDYFVFEAACNEGAAGKNANGVGAKKVDMLSEKMVRVWVCRDDCLFDAVCDVLARDDSCFLGFIWKVAAYGKGRVSTQLGPSS